MGGLLRRESLGLTTKTFMKLLQKGEITNEDIIRWAAGIGFGWVEVRDPDASMKKAVLEKLLSISEQLGIRIHYAWDGSDLLADGDESLFQKGLINAVVFGRKTYSRITLSSHPVQLKSGQRGYDKDAFDRLCRTIRRYDLMSTEHEVTIVYENAYEPLVGDGKTSFGFQEFMGNVPEMMMTFDPGNFMNKEQVKTIYLWDEIRDYYLSFKSRIPYIHLKSTKNNVLIDRLIMDGDIDYGVLLENAAPTDLFCIELPSIDDLPQCKRNIEEAYHLIYKEL